MTITDQQLADAIRERWENPVEGRVGSCYLQAAVDRALSELLLANPAPITPEVGKTYQHAETGNTGVYVGPNPDGPDGHYFKMKMGANGGDVIYWAARNIVEVSS